MAKFQTLVVALVTLFILSGSALADQPEQDARRVFKSPNGRIEVTFGTGAVFTKDRAPFYQVTLDGETVIEKSRMGLQFQGSGALQDLKLEGTQHLSGTETYVMPLGKNSHINDPYEEYTFALKESHAPYRELNIIFRVFNDGVAFRYFIPKQAAISDFVISEELTSINPAATPKIYGIRLPFNSSYEWYYRTGSIDLFKNGETIGLPMLIQYPSGKTLGITEADLTDYAGLYLEHADENPAGFVARLAPWPNEPDVKVRGTAPFASPWRVFMVGDSAKVVVESNIVTDLNPPQAFDDTSWIHPGKIQFPWWNNYVVPNPPAGITPGLNTWTLKHYIDFCAENHIEYHSIDGTNEAWYGGPTDPYGGQDITKAIPEIDLPQVLSYAKSKGVGTRIWLHWAGLYKDLDHALDTYESWGVSGIMLDFVNHDDQPLIRWYNEVLKKTAAHHLTVTFHGIFKPTGAFRTYPNLLVHEGVLGTEYDKWSDTGSTPEHEINVAYVRMMAGPLDVHQGSFRPIAPKDYKPTWTAPRAIGTLAREIAAYVVYENHLPMLADYPEAYTAKADAFQFVQEVPEVWDETHLLAGEVGKYITIGRRSGSTWYLGSMTDSDPREIAVPLDFLGTGKYVAEIYSDAADSDIIPDDLVIKRMDVTPSSILSLTLSPAGGNAARIYQLP
jgi:alpha-glucosidase